MADRKNIFLIGRRGHERDEDQLTEMLAYLWQEHSVALDDWLTGAFTHRGTSPDSVLSLLKREEPLSTRRKMNTTAVLRDW